jgi:transcriptional regulator with PAS, ATPase and Fis domain
VLQDGTFEPVGSSETRTTDARVIAATHRDLATLVAEERFRRDLLYRVNTVQLTVPPLRSRREDIPLLVEYFIERFNGLTGKEVRGLSGDAMEQLMRYEWPGNVRELEHAIEHAFVLVKEPTIDLSQLPSSLSVGGQPAGEPSPDARSVRAARESSERHAIEDALRRHRYNRAAASRELGLSRTTLWRKMRKLGIEA